MSNFDKVGTFMKTFGQEVKTKPSLSSDKINKLRIDLIKEELEELTDAMQKKDLLEVADALTDILYVTYGAGHAFGINLDACFNEVQNSNMSKLGKDGKPIYNESGKVMKGPNYFKPDLSKLSLKFPI
jgi:predicted HAD superfamily Cof-like phosphohydrolase